MGIHTHLLPNQLAEPTLPDLRMNQVLLVAIPRQNRKKTSMAVVALSPFLSKLLIPLQTPTPPS